MSRHDAAIMDPTPDNASCSFAALVNIVQRPHAAVVSNSRSLNPSRAYSSYCGAFTTGGAVDGGALPAPSTEYNGAATGGCATCAGQRRSMHLSVPRNSSALVPASHVTAGCWRAVERPVLQTAARQNGPRSQGFLVRCPCRVRIAYAADCESVL